MAGSLGLYRGRTVSRASTLALGIALVFVAPSLVGSYAVAVALPSGLGGVSAPTTSGNSGLAAAATFPTPIQHVVVVMDENQNYSTVLQDGPFEAYLARTYATATNDYSVHHGSGRDYQAAVSGTANLSFDNPAKNLGDLADAAGLSWAGFEQGMPVPCDHTDNWTLGYIIDHNPFYMFKDIVQNPARCDAHDLTWSSWTSDVNNNSIPNYSFIAPNTTNDDHNGTSIPNEIKDGDTWLKGWLSPLINDSAIFSDTAFLITFDEDAGNVNNTPIVNNTEGGHIYMVIVSPYSRGLSSDHFYNTYSLLTTAEWLLGIPGGTLLGGNDSWTLNPPMKPLFSFKSYSVTFTETGLASGTSWSVTLGGTTTRSKTSTIKFTEPDGTDLYTVGAVPGYSASPSSGSVTVDGAAVKVGVAFTAAKYTVTFTETGLPSGTNWSVTLNGTTENSTSSSIAFAEPNGTDPYTVGAVAGYIASPSSGSVKVDGVNSSVNVTFTPATYAVTFTETGLASGTNWSVTLNGTTENSTSSSIAFAEPNGTDPYTVGAVAGYAASPSSGSVTVNGAPVPVSVPFTQVTTYAVTFSESGLPSGLSWSVTFNGVPMSRMTDGGTDTLTFASEPSGSYGYSIAGISGWHQSSLAYSGTATVNGTALSVSMAYTQVTYTVTFTETGLASGTNWSVALTGGTSSVILVVPLGSVSNTVIRWSQGASTNRFDVSNGTYLYSASAPGYQNVAGSLNVTGGAAGPVMVTFTSISSSSAEFSPLDYVTIALVVVVAIALILILMHRRGKAHPVPATSASEPGDGGPPAPSGGLNGPPKQG